MRDGLAASRSSPPSRPSAHRTGRAPRRSVPLLGAGLLAVLLAGCAATTEIGPPSPTPADFPGIARSLAAHGVRVDQVVSGDAGCDDRDLIPTAIGFKATGVDEATAVPMHLYVFRNSESYRRLRPAVDACAASYVTDPAGYEAIDADPFVLVGQGPWPSGFQEALRAALTEAAGSSG